MDPVLDPHAGQPVLRSGPSPKDARLVAIMLHGRGASARTSWDWRRQFSAADIAYLAPQAAGSTWYPYPFLAPMQQNEPWLGSALAVIAGPARRVAPGKAYPAERVALMGFSQGACLALEFAARHARRYAAVAGVQRRADRAAGHAAATMPVGSTARRCSSAAVTVDPHIPLERVHESAAVFRRMGCHR